VIGRQPSKRSGWGRTPFPVNRLVSSGFWAEIERSGATLPSRQTQEPGRPRWTPLLHVVDGNCRGAPHSGEVNCEHRGPIRGRRSAGLTPPPPVAGPARRSRWQTLLSPFSTAWAVARPAVRPRGAITRAMRGVGACDEHEDAHPGTRAVADDRNAPVLRSGQRGRSPLPPRRLTARGTPAVEAVSCVAGAARCPRRPSWPGRCHTGRPERRRSRIRRR
jgi:hypothetical protein